MKILSAFAFSKELYTKNRLKIADLYKIFIIFKLNRILAFLCQIAVIFLVLRYSVVYAVFFALIIEIISYPLDFFLEYEYNLRFLKLIEPDFCSKKNSDKNHLKTAFLLFFKKFSCLIFRLISIIIILYSIELIFLSINKKEAVTSVFLSIQLTALSIIIFIFSYYINILLSLVLMIDFTKKNAEIMSIIFKSIKAMKNNFWEYIAINIILTSRLLFLKKYFFARNIHIYVTLKEWEEQNEQKRDLCRHRKSYAFRGFFAKRKGNFRKTST